MSMKTFRVEVHDIPYMIQQFEQTNCAYSQTVMQSLALSDNGFTHTNRLEDRRSAFLTVI